MGNNIACIIVTYNRKELLSRCIESVVTQSYRPSCIYVIDNASTDGTNDLFDAKNYVNKYNDVSIIYTRLQQNGGGSLGFYSGLKLAHESKKYDAYWVMDDDGFPDKECLEKMILYLEYHDYIAPIVLSDIDKKTMSFSYKNNNKLNVLISESSTNGVINDLASPFNGILYSKKILDTIGYPNKDMFMWGDEFDYHVRAKNNGFIPITILAAKHYHPVDRQLRDTSLFNQKVVISDHMWKIYCFHRNSIYNLKNHMSFLSLCKRYVIYAYYYLFKKKSLKWFKCFNDAFWNGLQEKFQGLSKYKE